MEFGEAEDGSHDVTTLIVFNALKRVLAFPDLARKNKGSASVLKASIDKAAKQACDIFAGKQSSAAGDVGVTLSRLQELKIQRVGLAGNKLGMEKARELYEIVIGDLDEHLDYPVHAEPPAPMNVAGLEASATGVGGKHSADEGDAGEDQPLDTCTFPIVVLKLSQSKSWLPSALLEGPELQMEREALVQAGFSPKLPSGAKIFVPPEAFVTVERYFKMQGLQLKTSHIVVSADMERKVMAVVEAAREAATRRESGSCKVTKRMEVSVEEANESPQPTTIEAALRYEVKRTFVHVPIPSSLCSTLSTAPITV